MREPSKTYGLAAVAVLLITAATSAEAGHVPANLQPASANIGHAPKLPAPPVTPRFLYMPDVAVAQTGCAPATHSSRFLEWWRQTWGTGVSHRARSEDGDAERTSAAFFYLRSPSLSGFYSRTAESAECAGGGASARHEDGPRCALVTLRLGKHDRLKRFEVALPQYDARTPRQLESEINARIEKGEVVSLLRLNGESYRLAPGTLRALSLSPCSGEKGEPG